MKLVVVGIIIGVGLVLAVVLKIVQDRRYQQLVDSVEGSLPDPLAIEPPTKRRQAYVMAHVLLRDLAFEVGLEELAHSNDMMMNMLWEKAAFSVDAQERLDLPPPRLELKQHAGLSIVVITMPGGAGPTEAILAAFVAAPSPRYFTLEAAFDPMTGAPFTFFCEWRKSDGVHLNLRKGPQPPSLSRFLDEVAAEVNAVS